MKTIYSFFQRSNSHSPIGEVGGCLNGDFDIYKIMRSKTNISDSLIFRGGKMSKTIRLLGLMILGVTLVFVLAMVGKAKADNLTVDKLTVNNDATFNYPIYANGNNIYFKGDAEMMVEMDYGNSQRRIKSNANGMYVYTYSDLHLDNGGMLYVHNASSFGGVADFTAGLTGTTGTFSGALAGTTGTFSGAVSGTTGTFTGAVSGSTGTFASGLLGHTAAAAPATALGEGAMYYDTAANLVYVNTGTAAAPTWTALGTATGLNLDASYGQFGAAASAIAVDAAEGQTGGLLWTLTNATDYTINVNSATSEFIIQDGGTAAWSWDSDGTLDVTPVAIGSDIIDITRNAAATAGDVLDIDMGAAAIAGDAIDISFGAGAATGDAVVVNLGDTAVGAGAFVVTQAGGARTDAIIDVTTASTTGDVANFVISGATTGHGINIDYSGIATGNGLDITYATAAATGNAVDLNMGTNLAGNAINIDLDGVRTGAGILIDDDSTRNAPAIDINVDTITTGNALDITYATAAATENAIDLNMGTNVAGDGVNIASAATTGNALDITATGVFTNELIDVNTTAAWTGNLMDIDVGTAISTGDVLNITYADVAHTGNAIETNNVTNLAGSMLSMVGTGARTGNQIDITTDETGAGPIIDINVNGIKAAGGNIIDITTGAVANASNYIDINSGNAAQTGDIFNADIAANAVGLQGFVVTNAAISTAVANSGWLLEVDSTAAQAANWIDFDSTAAWTGNMFNVDNTGNAIWTGNIFDINSGTGAATGDIMNLNIEAGSTALQAIVIDNDAITATDAWGIYLDTAAAWTGDAIVLDSTGNAAWTGDYFQMNAGTGAWTGDFFSIDGEGTIGTGHIFDIESGNGANTGDIMNILMEANDVAVQAFVVDNDAASTSAGWLMDVEIDGIAAVAAIDIVDSIARTGDIFSYDNDGNVAWTGDIFQITSGTGDASGDIMNVQFEAGATDLQYLTLNNDAASDQAGWMLNVDSAGIFTAAMINFDDTGNVAWTGDLISVSTGTGDSSGDIMQVLVEAGSTDNRILNIDNNAASDQAGWLMNIDSAGIFTASMINFDDTGNVAWTGNLIDIQTGTADSSGDIMNVNIEAGSTDNQVLVVDNDAATDQAGWLIDLEIDGVASAAAIDIVDSVARTGHILSYDNDGNAVWTGDIIHFTSGTGDATGDILDAQIEAGATDMRVVNINNDAASDQAGWLMNIDSSGVWTADMFSYDNTGNAATTGDLFSMTSGTGDVDGDYFDMTLEAGATSAQIFDINNAAVSDEAGWLLEADVTGVTTADAIDIDDNATTAAGAINIDYAAVVDGDIVTIADSGGARTTGHILAINDSSDATLTTGSAVHVTQSVAATDYSAVEIDTTSVGVADVGAGLDVAGTGAVVSGSSLVYIHSAVAAGGATAYGLHIEINGANNEAMHVDQGLVLIDEGGSVGPLNHAADGGVAADVYTMDATPNIPGCVAGVCAAGTMVIMSNPNAANTGACTLNVDAGGAVNIRVMDTAAGAIAAPAANDIGTVGTYVLVSDGTVWILINPATTTGE